MTNQSDERDIFAACVGLSPADRERVLADRCGGEPALADRIRRLLEAHDRARTAELGKNWMALPQDPPDLESYQLGRVLGEGGMGVVYEADQLRPVRRKVAIKLVRAGLDSNRIVARFEAERQALALMDHPNIAKVLDAGTTPDLRPYFVMELVEGLPLVRFCEEHRLNLSTRLELFLSLCRAVQHAHQKGVVHRDLKPSNVLVSLQDGQPYLKVIDFGIAKAIGLTLTDKTLHTQEGAALGTPAYMSPEQAVGGGVDVDTRSDIYSLGVILYELLTGQLPLDPSALGLHAFLVRLADPDFEPPPPSRRLAETTVETQRVADSFRTSPERLKADLYGDLDWVVMKAVNHDRERRYETAEALAAEIQRFLGDEPILARPPSRYYQLKKFARRNRPLLAAGAVALVALAIGLSGIVIGLIQADQGRVQAEQQALRAREAGRDAEVRLRSALLAQARALVRTRTPGQRFESLDLLSQAASIRPGEDLQDEAFAALALTDIRPVLKWAKPIAGPGALAFLPDLSRYAMAEPGGPVEIREAGNDQVLQTLSGPSAYVWGYRFSADASLLAAKYTGEGGQESFLGIWDLGTSTLRMKIPVQVPGMAFNFSPDGTILVYGGPDGSLQSVDVKSQRQGFQVSLGAPVYDLQFSRDGRSLALAGREPAGVWVRNAADGSAIRYLAARTSIYGISWSGDDRLLAGAAADGTVLVWDVGEGRLDQVLKGHQAEVVRVAFHPHHPILLSYGWDETTRFWHARTGDLLLTLSQQVIQLSADGSRMAAAAGDLYWIWEVHHGGFHREWYGHNGKGPFTFDLSLDGARIASGGLDGVLLWEWDSSKPVLHLPAGDVRAVRFVDDRTLITCGDQGLHRWDITAAGGGRSGRVPKLIRSGFCTHATLDPERQFLISTFPTVGVFLDTLDHEEPHRAFPPVQGMAHPAISRAARWLAIGNWRGDRTLVWDGATGGILAELLPGESAVAVAFSPEEDRLVTGSSREYRLWETSGWQEVARMARPLRFSNLPGKMAFSDDSRWLALAVDQFRIDVVDAHAGRRVASIQVTEPRLWTELRLTSGGSRLLATSSDNRIHLWELGRMAEELQRLGLRRTRLFRVSHDGHGDAGKR